jgi:urocanate hydratase
MGGVARRAWARNDNAIDTVVDWNRANGGRGHVTVPNISDAALLDRLVD